MGRFTLSSEKTNKSLYIDSETRISSSFSPLKSHQDHDVSKMRKFLESVRDDPIRQIHPPLKQRLDASDES